MKEIGIVGLGRFGRLLSEILRSDFVVKGFDHDPSKQDAFAGAALLHEVAACDTIFFCVPISRLEESLAEALPHVPDGAVLLDVCSVKLHAVEIMERLVPPRVAIFPTHPMFGPDSAAKGTASLPFVLCPTDRTPREFERHFSEYLAGREFQIVRMSPDEHDRAMAYSLCVTQLIGRALDRVGVKESPSDTRTFRQLLAVREVACNDTIELFRDMQRLNPYAREMRQRLAVALDQIERELSAV